MYLSDLLHINIHWTNLTHLHPISEYCIVFFSPKKLTTKVLKKYVFIRVPAMIYCYKLIQSIFSSRNTVLSNGNSDIYWWGVLLLGEMRSLNLLRLLYKRQACLPTKPCVRSKKHVLKKIGKFKHFFSQRKLIFDLLTKKGVTLGTFIFITIESWLCGFIKISYTTPHYYPKYEI